MIFDEIKINLHVKHPLWRKYLAQNFSPGRGHGYLLFFLFVHLFLHQQIPNLSYQCLGFYLKRNKYLIEIIGGRRCCYCMVLR